MSSILAKYQMESNALFHLILHSIVMCWFIYGNGDIRALLFSSFFVSPSSSALKYFMLMLAECQVFSAIRVLHVLSMQ